jgi:hypothetical protein
MKNENNLLEKKFKICDRKKIFIRWRWEGNKVLITYCNKYADRGIITLDPISSFVWVEISKKIPIKQIVDKVCKKYNLSRKHVELNMTKLLKTLIKKELIEEV